MLPLGTQAPDFELWDTISAQTLSLVDMKGEKGTVGVLIAWGKFLGRRSAGSAALGGEGNTGAVGGQTGGLNGTGVPDLGAAEIGDGSRIEAPVGEAEKT